VFTINGIDEVVFVDGGSAKAQRDFHQLMNSLRPTGVIG
jgi:predicted O-methyltransferase YrrM